MSPEGPPGNPSGTATAVLNNRFEVGERLAEGTFFFTHRARDVQTGQPVAIKVLKPEYAADEAFTERLLNEAQASRRLRHANIAQVIDAWRERGTLVIATEWVRGINLKDRIRRVAPFPLAVAMDIALACAQALAFAHENGFVHGDVRPDNVIITPDGRVKLTDFGVGSAVSASSRIQLNALPQAAFYLAPELAEGKAQDTRSDLYSLGCLLYEMLAGVPPYDADTPLAVAVKHLNDPIPSLKKINPSVPNAVDGLVAKCLQKAPSARYASPMALLEDIHRIREAIRTDQPLDWSPLGRTAEEDVAKAKTATRPRKPRAAQPEEVVDTGPSAKLLIGVFVLGLVMIAAFFGLFINLTSAPNQVTVPQDLLNKPKEQAIATLQKLGLKPEVVEEYSSRPVGVVFRTDPRSGTEIRLGKTVTLMVSKGPEPIKVPTVVDKELSAAKKALAAAGLKYGGTKEEFSDVIDKGNVISQSPAGGSPVQKGATVSLVVSKGPEQIPDPETVQVDPDPAEDTGEPDTPDAPDGNTPEENPDAAPGDLPVSKNEVAFPISRTAQGTQKVRIVVRNEDGTEVTAYEQDHQPGDQVSQTVTVYGNEGKGQIRVYLNGRLIYRKWGPPFN